MPTTVQVPVQLSVTQQFVTWQEPLGLTEYEEAKLLANIEENSRLPAAEQKRSERLRRK